MKQQIKRVKGKSVQSADTTAPSRKTSKATDTVASLKRDREALQAKLAAAEQQIAELEARQVEIVGRIDWVLDALSSLTEAQGSVKKASAANSRN